RDGLLVELVDVREWAAPNAHTPLPVPTTERWQAHSRATCCGGHVCLVLTPNGEIKVFARGAQVFSFVDGHWRLTDAHHKYETWRDAVGAGAVAERLFTVALTLAEDRRGALFLLLDDEAAAERLVPPGDLLRDGGTTTPARRPLQYLLRNHRLVDVAP